MLRIAGRPQIAGTRAVHTASFSLYTISLTSLKFFGSVIPDESGSGGGIGFQDGDAAAGPGEG